VRLFSAWTRRPARVLTSSGEFHSFRRQALRWHEAGAISLDVVDASAPDFEARFVDAASAGEHDIVFVSQVMFESGLMFDQLQELGALARPEGPWIVIDGYHGFMAVETDLSAVADRTFYLAGGYKYAMAGEGAAFLHAPPDFGPRPEITGWYAEFAALADRSQTVSYSADARRFLGATFDPSGLYRFNAVRRMLRANDLDTARINSVLAPLRSRLLEGLGQTPLSTAVLLNAEPFQPQARFLALRSPLARRWHDALLARKVITDVRGDVLRLGLALYHDEEDVERFLALAAALPSG